MLRRIGCVLLPVVVLCVVCISISFAQGTTDPVAEQGVRGTGVIKVVDTNIGQLDINVAKSGNDLFGGFRYAEMSPTGERLHIIYSQRITKLVIDGNYATVEAVGYWNRMWCDLVVEVEDKNPDWIRVVARPKGPITIDIIYWEEGDLVKGDIVVFGAPPVPAAATKGDGAIQVGQDNVGRFSFQAERRGELVKGVIHYAEHRPVTTPTTRPLVRIYVPEVLEFVTPDSKTAILSGRGTLNGRPAWVTVKAVDNRPPDSWLPVQDEFYIWARPLTDSVFAWPAYHAGGPLIFGDIVVVIMR